MSIAESIRTPGLGSEGDVQAASAKIKLQLFPINEQTRLGLEKVWNITSSLHPENRE